MDNHAITCNENSLCFMIDSGLLNRARTRVLSVDRKVESYRVEPLNLPKVTGVTSKLQHGLSIVG